MSEQIGGDDFDRVHELGAATLQNVLQKFDEKDWVAESNTAAENQMCAPTLSLTRGDTDHLFWVSSYLDGRELRYVNEFAYPLEDPGLISRLLRRTHSSPHTQELNQSEARRALELFASERYSDLLKHIRAA